MQNQLEKRGNKTARLGNQQNDDFPKSLPELSDPLQFVHSDEISATHPLEPGLFARHEGIPAHNQESLEGSTILGIGCGGLNSVVFVGLARSGARIMTVVDGDPVDRTNLSRQLYTAEDLGLPKGRQLAKHIAAHAVAGADVTGIGLPFDEAIERYPIPADLLIAGVDNNECRIQVVREARRRGVPAIFSMLSLDGMRGHVFLQNASPVEPCLLCALPNLDLEQTMPCASAIISSCFMMAGFTIFFAHRALMGWGDIKPFNWREADLSGIAPDRIGMVKKRPGCDFCG
mgnify:CR=1 FL=1